ncbi:unnamed protein product [Ixodes pacificus]
MWHCNAFRLGPCSTGLSNPVFFFWRVGIPNLQLLELEPSKLVLLEVELSEVKLSGLELSKPKLSRLKLSGLKLPRLELSGLKLPRLELSGLELSGLELFRPGTFRTGTFRTGTFRTGTFRTGTFRIGTSRTGTIRTAHSHISVLPDLWTLRTEIFNARRSVQYLPLHGPSLQGFSVQCLSIKGFLVNNPSVLSFSE